MEGVPMHPLKLNSKLIFSIVGTLLFRICNVAMKKMSHVVLICIFLKWPPSLNLDYLFWYFSNYSTYFCKMCDKFIVFRVAEYDSENIKTIQGLQHVILATNCLMFIKICLFLFSDMSYFFHNFYMSRDRSLIIVLKTCHIILHYSHVQCVWIKPTNFYLQIKR